MSPRSPHYIPVGCIGVARSEIEVEDSIWAANGNEWQYVQNPKSTMPTAVPEDVARHTMVDSRLRVALLKAPPLKAVESLFYGDWVQLQFRVFPSVEALGTFRIYILPDNAIRRLELRAQPGLTKHRAAVLGQVDCAPGAWLGTEAPVAFARNPFTQIISKKTETSLLELFNDIPSPAPDTSVVTDPFFKKAMSDILQSDIAGLKTELKPYQRRSAAMMMQKEIQPGQMLDPRFLHLQDQQRSSWYFDPIARTVSRDTGQYDGVSGGILAEEMGTGKTIICLALLLATRVFPSEAPGFYWSREPPMRKSIGSLMDMAASCATRHSQPWRSYFGYTKKEEYDGNPFVKALQRNPGVYYLPGPEPKRCGRTGRNFVSKPTKVYLSSTSLVIVPNNLLSQWRQEIKKHTEGLEVMVLAANDRVPDVETIVEHDVLLISQTRFEKLVKHDNIAQSPLASIHFKRCIIDEGHVLGNSRINHKSLLLLGLDSLQFTSRWIVTGTPSRGLFGARNRNPESANSSESGTHTHSNSNASVNQSSNWLERNDLEKLGSIAALYLKARPWANSARETEDTLAKWTAYLVPPRLGPGRVGRWDCLKSTVDSLIVRHRMEEVIDQLPPVDEKIVLLEGSYQDMLAMNLFAMMIIFNSVQSQRTDQDYFFHMKQRPSLLEIVHNLKQSSFFGGSFFTAQEIEKSVQTAEKFLEEQKVKISAEDDELLRTAIEFGRLALTSRLRTLSNQFHEMPICVAGFPGGAGKAWSLDGEMNGPICTSAPMVVALQKLLYHASGRPEELNSLLNGGLVQEGLLQREKVITEAHSTNITRTKEEKSKTLAGNTKLGDDSHSPKKARSRVRGTEVAAAINDSALAAAMAETKLVATVSAKLSYLIDSIVKYQDKEKMIIFYENPNVAWYLAGILEMLQIQHLIYAKGLTVERRNQYVDTFHYNKDFRVLLMDLSQAAFGLDMRAASRVYFINPVLNPQVQSQAIARVRRISQQRAVSVETLVLKDSIDEVILDRKEHMTQAEHGEAKSILDVAPINNWIKNAKIVPIGPPGERYDAQMVPLAIPLSVLGVGFGRSIAPDEGLVKGEVMGSTIPLPRRVATPTPMSGQKRTRDEDTKRVGFAADDDVAETLVSQPARRVRFTADSDEN